MTEIELKNVSYLYGKGTPFQKMALDNINLTFQKGIITGLIGHTGSGKSTLVQLLNGLLEPTSGMVCIDGKNIWEKPKEMRQICFRVGLVFQYPEYQLFEETVFKDIAFGPRNMGLLEEEVNSRVLEATEFVGIEKSWLQKSPFDLSGGQKRRVAIAGVLAMNPEVLILDEPAAGLDPHGREEILGKIKAYQHQKQNTMIIVSHSMEDMAKYADHIVVMNHAGIYLEGSCDEIFEQAEKLTSVGLDIPQITRLMLTLQANGVDVDTNVYTVKKAKEEILRAFQKQTKGGKRSC